MNAFHWKTGAPSCMASPIEERKAKKAVLAAQANLLGAPFQHSRNPISLSSDTAGDKAKTAKLVGRTNSARSA